MPPHPRPLAPMKADHSSPNNAPSKKRRTLLAGLGIGLCASVAGILRWLPGSSATPAATAATKSSGTLPRELNHSNAPAAAEKIPTGPVEEQSRDWYLQQLHTEFRMDRGKLGLSDLKLIEVNPAQSLRDQRTNTEYTSFSLVFEGDFQTEMESAVYPLQHEKLGKLELFLSPIGPCKEKAIYEAVICHKI